MALYATPPINSGAAAKETPNYAPEDHFGIIPPPHCGGPYRSARRTAQMAESKNKTGTIRIVNEAMFSKIDFNRSNAPSSLFEMEGKCCSRQ